MKNILRTNLTKENFWNEMMKLYPISTKVFCDWIDEYKEAVNWTWIFSNNIKFHHLPYEMQQGIWIEFVRQTLSDYFEQPEYEYSGDLEEDIKTVLSEMEKTETPLD